MIPNLTQHMCNFPVFQSSLAKNLTNNQIALIFEKNILDQLFIELNINKYLYIKNLCFWSMDQLIEGQLLIQEYFKLYDSNLSLITKLIEKINNQILSDLALFPFL